MVPKLSRSHSECRNRSNSWVSLGVFQEQKKKKNLRCENYAAQYVWPAGASIGCGKNVHLKRTNWNWTWTTWTQKQLPVSYGHSLGVKKKKQLKFYSIWGVSDMQENGSFWDFWGCAFLPVKELPTIYSKSTRLRSSQWKTT